MFNISDIQNKIGYTFKNLENLFTAFTHSSYANEHQLPSYERFEFLGDSIVNMVVASYLFKRFPDEDEGFLTKSRTWIVSTPTLAGAVDRLDVIKYLRTSGGALKEEILSSNHVKEDIFEAIVGAIMLDGSLEDCERFILTNLQNEINAGYTQENITDYKSKLLEYCAKHSKKAVFQSVKNEAGEFLATLIIDNDKISCGVGHTKKKAEQEACKIALENNIKQGE